MIVVKIGGSIADECAALVREVADRDDAVLVHGFGPQTTRLCRARGVETRTLRSPNGMTSRFTDQAVLDVMQDAAQQTRTRLVRQAPDEEARFEAMGLKEPLFEAEAKPALRHEREDGRVVLVRGNRSGRVTDVQTRPVQTALETGHTPVVTPFAKDEHGLVSIDADRAAAALAGRLDASSLVLLTDVPGLLEDPSGPAARIEHVPVDQIKDLFGTVAHDGMARKLVAAREAIQAGVDRVMIARGQGPDPIQSALSGDGTEVHP